MAAVAAAAAAAAAAHHIPAVAVPQVCLERVDFELGKKNSIILKYDF